ncbi:MAG TPA: SRPBCC family protein [Bryobacteraceae bacterium]|nr:SRPBCC family protein [Bryobacteraceae bacterium]
MIVTKASLKDTFQFFEDPRNLARITPPWMGFEIVTHDPVMQKGLKIDYRFRWLGLPMTWRTLISEYDPPYLFVDEALKSPYRLWRHRHTFEETEGGTIVRDHVDYALPLGPLGAIANRLVVKRQLSQIFAYRQSKIRELIGAYANT